MSLAVLAICAAPAVAQQSIQTAFNYNLADEAAAPPKSRPRKRLRLQLGCGCAKSRLRLRRSQLRLRRSQLRLRAELRLRFVRLRRRLLPVRRLLPGRRLDAQELLRSLRLLRSHGRRLDGVGLLQRQRSSVGRARTTCSAFDDYPDHLNLDQAWVYFEKIAEADACSADWGYRFDMVYGVDAQKTQAFGNDDNVWDVSFDNGSYGWAMPQAYAEVGFGDWSVKVGHFFTLVGYEVIPATGNFFYSHSYTMFNSEPFTHTGVLGTYTASDDDDGLRRLDARLGHRLRPGQRRQQLARRFQHARSATT